jgi:hypothetical protein
VEIGDYIKLRLSRRRKKSWLLGNGKGKIFNVTHVVTFSSF